MAKVSAGVVGGAELYGGPRVSASDVSPDTPAFWTMVWFAVAVLFLLFIHFAGRR